MIDCENCILKSALESDTGKCCVNCLDLEDALREHDKQIRAEVIEEVEKLMKEFVNFENVDVFVNSLRELKEQK